MISDQHRCQRAEDVRAENNKVIADEHRPWIRKVNHFFLFSYHSTVIRNSATCNNIINYIYYNYAQLK